MKIKKGMRVKVINGEEAKRLSAPVSDGDMGVVGKGNVGGGYAVESATYRLKCWRDDLADDPGDAG